MAEGDPLLGEEDPYRGDLVEDADGVPVLYHADSSYFSMIARLALEEKGAEWKSRLTDIHAKMEHLQPWYLAISPGGCVPTLVHRGHAVPESLDIIRYVDAQLPGTASLTPSSPAMKQRMEDFIRIHYSFEIEDFTLGYLQATILPMRIMGPKMMAGTIPKLEKLKEDNPDITETIDRKIAQNRARLDKFSDPDGLYQATEPQVVGALDALENVLTSGGGPFICGKEYSLADVLFTCLLGRAFWAKPMHSEIEARPSVQEYWNLVQDRPSFKSADIWTSLRFEKPLKMFGPKIAMCCCCCCCCILLAVAIVAGLLMLVKA